MGIGLYKSHAKKIWLPSPRFGERGASMKCVEANALETVIQFIASIVDTITADDYEGHSPTAHRETPHRKLRRIRIIVKFDLSLTTRRDDTGSD